MPEQTKPMAAREIVRALCRARYAASFVLPNYTPRHWWECDVFEMTTAGYFREYEVKISRSDFFADKRKERDRWLQEDGGWKRVHTKKHDAMLSDGSAHPTRFWYVVPEGLVQHVEIPPFAGLIEIYRKPHGRLLHEREALPAPTLHRNRIDPQTEEAARRACYWRMHRLLHLAHL